MKKSIISFLLCLCFLFLTACNADKSNSYIPYGQIPKDYSLQDAKSDDLVVHEHFIVTSGQSVWEEFINNSYNKIPGMVRLAYYYRTETSSNINIQDLSYDGEKYTLFSIEEGKEYIYSFQYLKRFECTEPFYSDKIWFALVNNNEATGEQILSGSLSSRIEDKIDHKIVYSEYIGN